MAGAVPILVLKLLLGPRAAWADVDLKGAPTSVQVFARRAQASEVLVALGARFGVCDGMLINWFETRRLCSFRQYLQIHT